MYQIRKVTLKHGKHERTRLIIEFFDRNMDIVGEFLMTDASLLDWKIVKDIDRVLSGEKERVESIGNRCAVTIKADKTLIADLFKDRYDGVETLPSYQIETVKLRHLILMWIDRLKEVESNK